MKKKYLMMLNEKKLIHFIELSVSMKIFSKICIKTRDRLANLSFQYNNQFFCLLC